jgi:transcriptional regulator with XRE-family HTH domain
MDALGTVSPAEVRTRFGVRLRELRFQAGFKTARAFARALEMEENRYTRYERGEVEPNLLNIGRMCHLLRVDANRLLGLTDGSDAQAGLSLEDGRISGEATGASRSAEAWRLASVIASLRSSNAGHAQSPGISDPLLQLRATAEIYRRLLSDNPTDIFAQFLNDDTLNRLELSHKTELVSLIDVFMGTRDTRK